MITLHSKALKVNLISESIIRLCCATGRYSERVPQRVGSSSSSTSSRFYRQFGSYQRRHSSLTGRDVRRQFLPLKLNFSGASYDQTTDRHSTSLPYLSSDNQQRPQPVYPSNRIRIYNGTHTKRIYSEAYDVMELQAPAGKQSDYTARAIANVGSAWSTC